MDVIGYMFLLKSGGNAIPKGCNPIFDDLDSIGIRESQLAFTDNIDPIPDKAHCIGFKDDDFRQFTGLKLNSSQIRDLLFKLHKQNLKFLIL